MAQREGSVYLYLFIVASILFMAMTVWFFVGSSENQRLQARITTLESDVKKRQDEAKANLDQVTQLRVLIAGPNAATQEWPGNEKYLQDMKDKVEAAINEARTTLKEPRVEYADLVTHQDDVRGLLQKLISARNEAFTKESGANDAMIKAKETSAAEVAALNKNFEQSRQELTDTVAKLEDVTNRSQTEKADLVKQMETKEVECNDEIIKKNRQVVFLQNQIRALETKIDILQAEVNKEKGVETIRPDGELVNVLGSTGKGWINLGRVHHLRTGLLFRVFQYVKGEKKHFKGTVEVTRVDETSSEVRIVEEVDSLNPIVKGDMVSSPFYDKDAQPVFVFAGSELDTREITRELLVAKIRAFGGQVSDKVEIGTDFLVAIKNFESTPEYKTAREFNVTVLRERDLLEFLGL